MRKEFEHLYSEFLEDIHVIQTGVTEKESVEENYWKAKKYWEKLKDLIRGTAFENDEEEIEFFKTIKPSITSSIEYYVLLSEALLFVPGNRPTDSKEHVISFWHEQHKRCQRFFKKNQLMLQYYENGDTSLDDTYFLRRNNSIDARTFSPAPVFEESNEYCTYADPVLRGVLAYKKYNAYVINQLKLLQSL